jgi:type IV secretion system protein VirB8
MQLKSTSVITSTAASSPKLTPEESKELADKIRSGEYFTEAMKWYSLKYHSGIAERSFYIIITAVAIFTTWFSFQALVGLLPLEPTVPYLVRVQSELSERPEIRPLTSEQLPNANHALMAYYLKEYVRVREEFNPKLETEAGARDFNIRRMTLNFNRVRHMSSPQVYAAFRQLVNPANPRSPIRLYELRTRRAISIASYQFLNLASQPYKAMIRFDAVVQNLRGVKKSQFIAEISFTFKDVEVDQETGKVVPARFIVTSYTVREVAANAN